MGEEKNISHLCVTDIEHKEVAAKAGMKGGFLEEVAPKVS